MRWAWIAMVVVASGCAEWRAWDDVPTAVVTPVAAPERMEAWSAIVSHDVGVWNLALTALGCPTPFTIGPAGHPVALVDREVWRYDTAAGYTDPRGVVVRALEAGIARDDGTTAHELGHALGLEHADPTFGPSVMLGKGHETRAPLPRDIAAAACALDCAPCDPAADPYSIP